MPKSITAIIKTLTITQISNVLTVVNSLSGYLKSLPYQGVCFNSLR